jgi:hypothetical protein
VLSELARFGWFTFLVDMLISAAIRIFVGTFLLRQYPTFIGLIFYHVSRINYEISVVDLDPKSFARQVPDLDP